MVFTGQGVSATKPGAKICLMQNRSVIIMKLLFIALTLLQIAPFAAPADGQSPAPLIVPDADRLQLDGIGLYAAGYQYRGQAEQRFPSGWSGGFEDRTGVALQPAGEQNGQAAFLMHPPWRGGTGVAFQEFCFRLPAADIVKRIRLVGLTAMRSDALAGPGEKPKSDGATFRILANGRTLLDENRADAKWKSFAFDLTALAGQTVTLRFETDPGPRNSASFDFALWGGRELLLEGYTPKPPPPATLPPPMDLQRLYPMQNGEVAPPSGYAGKLTTEVRGDKATLTYSGADGMLQYELTRPITADDPPLGRWQLRAIPHGEFVPQIVPLANDARLEWRTASKFKASRLESAPDGVTCISTYEVDGHPATLRCTAKLSGKSLVLELNCDAPQITAINAGGWGPVLHRRSVPVPYYTGQVYYFKAENLFVSAFLDWTKSSASTHQNTIATYGARTDGTRVSLHERVVFAAGWNLAETLPNLPNPPSPYREHLADKIVLDIWGGQFVNIASNLTLLHDYGLNNCAVIIHNWQRSGYDNALPAHVPANAKLGGDDGMKTLVTTAKRLGYDIALHENYVDYYPNYEGFRTNDVALDSKGNLIKAWFNKGTKIQSFAIQPHAILPLAHSESAKIHERYQPNANFLDVHSSVMPWFHVDYRAGAEGAATFKPVWETHRLLWAFERKNHGGPVFGEGCRHWFWSGLLDGVEAQFGFGWPQKMGQTAPLMVDFDLLKIHPLQFNHGMGYYDRWWGEATWGALPPLAVLDQYRMQEVIYGHAGFLGSATYANVPLAWLEHHLLSPVTARYASAQPVKIEYQVAGRWVDGTTAARAGIWNRARVSYDNGLVVTANSDTNTLRENAFDLPQSGWLAKGAGVTAWTAQLQGVIADYAQTPDSTFANARAASVWDRSGIHHILPTVAGFRQTGSRSFTLAYQWRVGETLSRDYHCFVHFVNGENISFQNDHRLPRPSSTWKTGETLADGPHAVRLPEGLSDGDYGVRIGLFSKEGGRLALQGHNDGQNAIRLGTLHVRDGGQKITFEAEAASNGDDDLYQHRLNLAGQVLDFGDVRTDGSLLVRREAGEWVLRALPRAGDFLIELSAARFGHPASVRCVEGSAPAVTPPVRGDWWRLKLNGAREYRWK